MPKRIPPELAQEWEAKLAAAGLPNLDNKEGFGVLSGNDPLLTEMVHAYEKMSNENRDHQLYGVPRTFKDLTEIIEKATAELNEADEIYVQTSTNCTSERGSGFDSVVVIGRFGENTLYRHIPTKDIPENEYNRTALIDFLNSINLEYRGHRTTEMRATDD